MGKVEGSDQENTRTSTDSFHEEPVEEFTKAIADLIPISLSVCEIDNSWKEGVTVKGFTVKETKQGSRSVVISLEKELENHAVPWKFKTPQFHIDKPAAGEGFEMEIKPAQAAKVGEALLRTEKYRDGERSQQLLFDPNDGTSEEEGGEDELQMI